MATNAARARFDLGKLIMIPFAAMILVIDLASLSRHTGGGVPGAVHWLGVLGFCAFYALVIWCYLRRGPAAATSRSATAHAAAVVATLMPFALPVLQAVSPGPEPGPGQQLAGSVLVLAGVVWSFWSLRCLGSNLSVVAQARGIADRGPYHLVRHPLYTGELVSALGLAIIAWSPATAVLWLALCGLQAYRAYRARTAALLPGIF